MKNTLETPLGPLSVLFDEKGLVVRVLLGKGIFSEHVNPAVMERLHKYLSGVPVDFEDIAVSLKVTPFVHKVLRRVRQIPFGKTVTYGELARELGTSSRAVGMALSRNPVPVIIPCHRVVGKGGRLVGFSSGLKWKRFLLEIEGCAE